jgi:hypothetical protein
MCHNFIARAWSAQILIGAILGVTQVGAVAAEPGTGVRASMVLLDLQNELILGTQLSPMMAACLDDGAADGWVLPSQAQIEISERTQQRKQRARERCSASLSGMDEGDITRSTSEAIHKEFAEQLQARLALEKTKESARRCIARQRDSEGFQRCMTSDAPTVAAEGAWPRWLALFVRYQSTR